MRKNTPTENTRQPIEDREPKHRGRIRAKRHTAKQQRQRGRRSISAALTQMLGGW